MQERLQRVLGTPEVLFIGINGVVGGGIFLLPGQVAQLAGPSAVFVYLAAGALVTLIGLSYAEAGAMFDRTGGPIVYTREAVGRTAGFTVGWMMWLTYLAGWAVLGNGFIGYLAEIYPATEGYGAVIIVAIVALLCLLNTLGVKLSSGIIQFFTVAKLLPLLLLIIVGLAFTGNVTLEAVPSGTGGFLAAVLVVIFAYGGFEGVTVPSGEMVNPRRAVAVGVLGTLTGVTVFYMLIQYAAMRLKPDLAETVGSSTSPLASVGEVMFAGGLVLLTVGALVSIFGTQSGVALISPRNLYSLSREGMLPAFLSRTSQRFSTPAVAICATGTLVVILAVSGTFTQLLLLNVAARLYQYFMVCLSVAILRYRQPDARRPFRLPLGITIPAVAAVLCIGLVTQQPPVNLLLALGALAVGLVLYLAGRQKT